MNEKKRWLFPQGVTVEGLLAYTIILSCCIITGAGVWLGMEKIVTLFGGGLLAWGGMIVKDFFASNGNGK